jgi:hypothetical protein
VEKYRNAAKPRQISGAIRAKGYLDVEGHVESDNAQGDMIVSLPDYDIESSKFLDNDPAQKYRRRCIARS